MNDKYLENIDALEQAMSAKAEAENAYRSLPQQFKCLYFQTVSEPLARGNDSLRAGNYAIAIERFKKAHSAATRLTAFLDQLTDVLRRYRDLNESDVIRDTGALARQVAQSEQELVNRLQERGNMDRATDMLLSVAVTIEELEASVKTWNAIEQSLKTPSNFKPLYDSISNKIRNSLVHDTQLQLSQWNIRFFEDTTSKRKLVQWLKDYESLMSKIRESPFRKFSWNAPDLANVPNDVLHSKSIDEANDILVSGNKRIESIRACIECWDKSQGKMTRFQSIVSTLEQLPSELVNEMEQLRNCTDPTILESKPWTESSVTEWTNQAKTSFESIDSMLQTILGERTKRISKLVDYYINLGMENDDELLPKVRSFAKAVLQWNSIAPNYVQIPPGWRDFSEDETGFRDEEYNVENMVEVIEDGPSYHQKSIQHRISSQELAKRAAVSSHVACFYAHWLLGIASDKARKLLEKLAKDGCPQGMNNFAVVLCREENYDEAQSWFTKAAALGNDTAAKNLRLVQLFAAAQDETTA